MLVELHDPLAGCIHATFVTDKIKQVLLGTQLIDDAEFALNTGIEPNHHGFNLSFMVRISFGISVELWRQPPGA